MGDELTTTGLGEGMNLHFEVMSDGDNLEVCRNNICNISVVNNTCGIFEIAERESSLSK